jgi:hypothetical protein
METSIRFVRVNGKNAIKPGLCFRGRNQALAVINDDSIIRVIDKISLRDHDAAPIVMGPNGFGQTSYPIDLFVKRFDEIGARKGITRRAKFLLEKALTGGIADDTVLPPDVPVGQPAPERPKRDASKPSESPSGLTDIARSGSSKPKAAPAAPPPRRTATKAGIAGKPGSRTAGAAVIVRIAAEMGLETTKLRKLLRSKGLNAPYDDEAKIRKVLGK